MLYAVDLSYRDGTVILMNSVDCLFSTPMSGVANVAGLRQMADGSLRIAENEVPFTLLYTYILPDNSRMYALFFKNNGMVHLYRGIDRRFPLYFTYSLGNFDNNLKWKAEASRMGIRHSPHVSEFSFKFAVQCPDGTVKRRDVFFVMVDLNQILLLYDSGYYDNIKMTYSSCYNQGEYIMYCRSGNVGRYVAKLEI